jgi:hypothetical protein
MYAVIRRYQFDKSKSEELNRKVRETFLPLIKKAPGFVAYYWLDTGGGTGASLSVFQNKAGAEESVRAAAKFVQEHLGGITISKPDITEGEVHAHS